MTDAKRIVKLEEALAGTLDRERGLRQKLEVAQRVYGEQLRTLPPPEDRTDLAKGRARVLEALADALGEP